MDAQGALDSLLGRLTSILVDEAQLLGGVRGDVEFIKDEMESMNGLVLHLTEAQHRDHQVRAWMKQVVGLTRDCEGNVELYIHYVDGGPGGGGVLGYLQRVIRFLRTVRVRHQIATRIQELKVRARDVGDRRKRYGVTVPPWAASRSTTHDDDDVALTPGVALGEKEDRRRREALLDGTAEPLHQEEINSKCLDFLVKLLCKKPAQPAAAIAGDGSDPRLRVSVFFVTRDSTCQYSDVDWVVQQAYHDSCVRSSFDFKDLVECKESTWTMYSMVQQVTGNFFNNWSEEEVMATKLQEHLRGKRFLIFLRDGWHVWNQEERLRSILLEAADCTHGSAIILTQDPRREHVAVLPRPHEIQVIVGRSSVAILNDKANKLTANAPYCDMSLVLRLIFLLQPDLFAAKMLLHLLYVNAYRTREELQNYYNTISECQRLNKSIANQMLAFCYNELPTKYKNCLLYLTIFPEGHIIRTASLARRWVAEGLIITKDDAGSAAATDEAEHYLDVLVTRGFLSQEEVSAQGNIRSCTVHDQVRQFIARIAREVNFLRTNLPPQLAHHLSIHNRIGLQTSHFDVKSKDIIVAFLPTLATSPQWQLLKVLDLEKCRGLKKHHLKSICKILLLRYLSLRNTDIKELPKQIEKLQCLETLDIRETAIRAFSTKSVKLPLLKYFLAGHTIYPNNRSDMFEESFEAVRLPSSIRRMEKLEVMSHVEVSSNVHDLTDIGHLLQLRKLGVVLHGTKGILDLLFQQIDKLHDCLRSLSIRINQPTRNDSSPDAEVVPALVNPPKLLENLSIYGIKCGLPNWVAHLDQLMKVTLRETFLSEDTMHVLGKLRILRCLRLLNKSYTGRKLNFIAEEFQQLRFLVVKGKDITNISFDTGATTKLEMIVWSFGTMEALSLSGVDHLPRLKKLELNGDCNLDPVKAAIEEHPNHPELKHNNPHPQRQEDGTAAASSPLSAP